MDGNKLKVLADVGYTIEPSCGLCRYGVFTPQSQFGTCSLHLYEHQKHTGEKRQLSVYRSGRCATFQADDLFTLLGEAWAKLFRQPHHTFLVAKIGPSGTVDFLAVRPSAVEAKDEAVRRCGEPLEWGEVPAPILPAGMPLPLGGRGQMWFSSPATDERYIVAELGAPAEARP